MPPECLNAHPFIGGKVGLTDKDIADARPTNAASDKTDAILKLALSILVQRSEISDDALKAARNAGLTDGEIVETTANVAFNIFSNHINYVARTLVDFPEVKPGDPEVPAEACSTPGRGCGHRATNHKQPSIEPQTKETKP